MTVTLLHAVSPAPEWCTIHRLVDLASRLLGVPAIAIEGGGRGRLTRLLNQGAPRKQGSGGTLVAILTSGLDLVNLRLSPEFRQGFDRVGVWIVDSFRTEHISRLDSFTGIDLLAISQDYDQAFYAARHAGAQIVLPYGTDALDQPAASGDRLFDVGRFGRQPDPWADDDVTGADCGALGLSFHGRPPFSPDSAQNNEHVQRLLRSSRCALAFSNLVSSESYTHRTKPYFSTRWADALACGAAVAGVPPLADQAFGSLLWEGALIPFETVDRAAGLAEIARFCSGWTERTARFNQAQALLRLDWRWRFKTLFERLDITCPTLDRELRLLEARAADLLRDE